MHPSTQARNKELAVYHLQARNHPDLYQYEGRRRRKVEKRKEGRKGERDRGREEWREGGITGREGRK
jgi:hypothetical protein